MSRTWWVETSIILSSVIPEAMILRHWLLLGMSSPLVGSSMMSTRVLVARAKLINTFFFCPMDNDCNLQSCSISKMSR